MKSKSEIEAILVFHKKMKQKFLQLSKEKNADALLIECNVRCSDREQIRIELLEEILEIEK